MKKFICVEDTQEQGFQVGKVGTIEEWRELAYILISDEETCEELKHLQKEDVIDYICDMFSLVILDSEELFNYYKCNVNEIDTLLVDYVLNNENNNNIDFEYIELKLTEVGIKTPYTISDLDITTILFKNIETEYLSNFTQYVRFILKSNNKIESYYCNRIFGESSLKNKEKLSEEQLISIIEEVYCDLLATETNHLKELFLLWYSKKQLDKEVSLNNKTRYVKIKYRFDEFLVLTNASDEILDEVLAELSADESLLKKLSEILKNKGYVFELLDFDEIIINEF